MLNYFNVIHLIQTIEQIDEIKYFWVLLEKNVLQYEFTQKIIKSANNTF